MRIDSMDWFNSKGHGICASIGRETHGALQSNLGSLKEYPTEDLTRTYIEQIVINALHFLHHMVKKDIQCS